MADNPVADKDYSVLPKQQAFKVHAPDAPDLVEGAGDNLKTVHSVMLTNDMYVTWTTGQPGDVFPLHTHMPEMYQILTTIKGRCVWYYKDNDGNEQSIEAGPGDVVYLPGGAENRVEVIGDEEHIHIGSYPRVRVARRTAHRDRARRGREPEGLPRRRRLRQRARHLPRDRRRVVLGSGARVTPDPMELTSLDAIPISVPKATALRTGGSDASTAGSDTFDHVLVRAETADGVVGYGEVAPHPDWPNSGTQATVQSVIESEFAPLVAGRDPSHVARIVDELDRTVASHPFALAGVDAALYDALGKQLGRPTYELLGGPTAADRSLPLHYTVGIKEPDAVREEVAAAADRGFSAFKLKVGADERDADRRRLEAVRETCPGARIRVDANGSWAAGEAVRAIRELNQAADGIVFVEQPVPRDDVAGLARVRSAVEPSVMADEGCYGPTDVASLARANAVDAINVKPAKAGGITGAKRVAAVAAAHGLPCYVGGMLELGVGAAAAAHFALATPKRAYPTGLLNADADGSLLSEPDRWAPDGPAVAVPDDPGMGVSVDPTAVERYRID